MKKAFIFSLVLILSLSSGIFSSFKHGKVYAESNPVEIGFVPSDTALDPNKPVVYMTKLGSKTIYSVNYETGVTKKLILPYAAERLEIYKNKLYVTQVKESHNRYNSGPYSGVVAEVDLKDFSTIQMIDIDTDPFDLAFDPDGYMYISPGSGQWGHLSVYSLKDRRVIPQKKNYLIYSKSYITYNSSAEKLYSYDTTGTPVVLSTFEIKGHQFEDSDRTNISWDYNLSPFARITPDGLHMYNNNGLVMDLSPISSGDTILNVNLYKKYNDYAFDLANQLTYAANTNTGIEIYKYNSNQYLRTFMQNLKVQTLLYQNGLIAIYKDKDDKVYLEKIRDAADQEPPSISIKLSNTAYTNHDVIATITATDNYAIRRITLPDGSSVNGSKATFLINENGGYIFTVEDINHNIQTKTISIMNIDKTPPKVSSSYPKPINNTVTLTVLAEDDDSGIKLITMPDGKIVNSSSCSYTVIKNGTYKFKVEDLAGNVTTKSITVDDLINPDIPTVHEIGDSSKIIEGKTSANVDVYAKVGKDIIGKTKASSIGNFKINIHSQKAGTKITVLAIDSAGNQSQKTVTVVDKTPPSIPVIQNVTTKTKTITGNAEKSSIVYVYYDNQYINKSKTINKGQVALSLKGKHLKKGHTLKIYAVDSAKNKSRVLSVKVK